MKASSIVPAILFVAGVVARTGEFEAQDFNVTEALIANGVSKDQHAKLCRFRVYTDFVY
jgi:hypothetical protein